MDERLLAEARQAQERLIEAEHQAEVARAEFHRAVRRLHLSGSSLRELAAALGLSHQRIHQIIEAVGGGRRWGQRRDPRPDLLVCTFCGKSQKQVKKLIAGPGVYICDGCAELARGVIATGQAAETGLGPIRTVAETVPVLRGVVETRERCGFCGKHRGQCTGLAAMAVGANGEAGRHAAICAECLTLCEEIIAEGPAVKRRKR
jgi:hypothetical protein